MNSCPFFDSYRLCHYQKMYAHLLAVTAQCSAYLDEMARARSAEKGYAIAWKGCTGGSRPAARSLCTCINGKHGPQSNDTLDCLNAWAYMVHLKGEAVQENACWGGGLM